MQFFTDPLQCIRRKPVIFGLNVQQYLNQRGNQETDTQNPGKELGNLIFRTLKSSLEKPRILQVDQGTGTG